MITPVQSKKAPALFGPEETWRVQDEYGNFYEMKKIPSSVYVKKGNTPRLHLVYDVIENKSEKKNPF